MELKNLTPATHVVPAPEQGWRGVDLDPAELVDDDFIEADPNSMVLPAIKPKRGVIKHGA